MHTRARTKEGTRFALVALLFVLFLALSACGGQGGAGESAAPAPEQAPATAGEAGAETASLHFVDAETGSARTNGAAPVYSAPGGRELYQLPADSPVQVLAAAAEEAEAAEAQWLLITSSPAEESAPMGWVEAALVTLDPIPGLHTEPILSYQEPAYGTYFAFYSAPVYELPSENARQTDSLVSGSVSSVIAAARVSEGGGETDALWLLLRCDPGVNGMGWVRAEDVKEYTPEDVSQVVYPLAVRDGARCFWPDGEPFTAEGEAFLCLGGYDGERGLWRLYSHGNYVIYVENYEDILFPEP